MDQAGEGRHSLAVDGRDGGIGDSEGSPRPIRRRSLVAMTAKVKRPWPCVICGKDILPTEKAKSVQTIGSFGRAHVACADRVARRLMEQRKNGR
jgi:hypothetical protein